jgi:translation initiation factor IF-2
MAPYFCRKVLEHMTDSTDKKPSIRLSRPNTLSLTKTVESGQVRQNVQGRQKTVTVEVRKTRVFRQDGSDMVEMKRGAAAPASAPTDSKKAATFEEGLSNAEREARLRALEAAKNDSGAAAEKSYGKLGPQVVIPAADAAAKPVAAPEAQEEAPVVQEVVAEERATEAEAVAEADNNVTPAAPVRSAEGLRIGPQVVSAPRRDTVVKAPTRQREAAAPVDPADIGGRSSGNEKAVARRAPVVAAAPSDAEDDHKRVKGKLRVAPTKRFEDRRGGKVNVNAALDGDEAGRQRSLASLKRAREKANKKGMNTGAGEKIVREVVIPEAITVQELANRMSERAVDVVKALMKMGTMVTVNQAIDADTAELIVGEFGHTFKRVTDADVENVLRAEDHTDDAESLKARPPIVTIMGHVDHGKTSLLDALRKTDVVAGEAGGITQHIGAYQVTLASGGKITFFDTPGHAAFTAMRARGAKATDIVVLVVAADDGVMEQTKEAIAHAKAAEVPIIVAINKCDKPAADPNRVKSELLQYELVGEEFGGQVQMVEVSAKQGIGLDKLEEAILLQAEILELQANPDRKALGVVVESRMDQGRGVVATLLVQKGTLKRGEIVVAGTAYGRVRAMLDDKGRPQEDALPAMPVEILGLDSAPDAGDEFAVVENEKTARDITEYRRKVIRDRQQVATGYSLDKLFSTVAGEEKPKELHLIVKADVNGSAEAIVSSLQKLSTDEVTVRVVHSGVGMISESDVTLAKTTNAIMIGFNVRANAQSRDLAAREKISIRYYSIIYDLVDDVRAALSGLLSPELRETILGYAEIREVFNITKAGKIAGCYVTEGMMKRGAKVRLLRDSVVIHEGALKTLKRFKDDVKEVQQGFECGMAFENYEDIRPGDQIEAFEIESIARTL